MTDRTRATLRRTRRVLYAAGALFATVFCLLALQLWMGRDPALGKGGEQRGAAPAQSTQQASAWDTVLAVAAGLLNGGEGERSPSTTDGSSGQASTPQQQAPLQSGTS